MVAADLWRLLHLDVALSSAARAKPGHLYLAKRLFLYRHIKWEMLLITYLIINSFI
jgi:hypothetical protein